MENENVFVDTSAFYALMDGSDNNHKEAARLWEYLLEKNSNIKTSNYAVIETLALLQSRLGFEAANLCYRDVLGITEILWVDEKIHNLAFELWLGFGRRRLSLADCSSFAMMRHFKLEKVFGFDNHFREQGFEIIK
jgi:predicted nucleic acid-binding protein